MTFSPSNQQRSNRSRGIVSTAAITMAMALVAAACGGDDGSATATTAIAGSETTLASGENTAAAPETTAAPEVESDETETTTTIDERSDEDLGLDVTVDDSLVLGPELNRNEVMGVASGTLGPTDDVMAEVRRLTPITYDLPTMAGTEIIDHSHFVSLFEEEAEFVTFSSTIQFISTADRADVVLAYTTALEGDGWSPSTGERVLGDVASSTVSARGSETPEIGTTPIIDISIVDRVEGGSIVDVNLRESSTDLTMVGRFAGWYGNGPFLPGGWLRQASVRATVDINDNRNHVVFLDSDVLYSGTVLEDILGQTEVAGTEWTVTDDSDPDFLRLEYLGDSAFLSFADLDMGAYASLSQQVIVAAATPGSAATEATSESTVEGDTDLAASFAEPSGPTLSADMNHEAIETLLIDLLGPTDDVAADLARLGPFPQLATMPDTIVIDVWANYKKFESFAEGAPDQGQRITRSEMITTAAPEDTVVAIQTELTGNGWAIVQSDTEERDGVTYHSVRVESPTDNGNYVSVTAFELDSGETFVDLDYVHPGAPADIVEVTSGWYGQPPFAPGGDTEDTSVMARFGVNGPSSVRVEMSTRHEYTGVTGAELLDLTVEALDATDDWALNELDGDTLWLDFVGVADQNIQTVTDTGDDGDSYFKLQYSRLVEVG